MNGILRVLILRPGEAGFVDSDQRGDCDDVTKFPPVGGGDEYSSLLMPNEVFQSSLSVQESNP